jgi:hypothetical protein
MPLSLASIRAECHWRYGALVRKGSKSTGPKTRLRRRAYPQDLTIRTTPPQGRLVPVSVVSRCSNVRGLFVEAWICSDALR